MVEASLPLKTPPHPLPVDKWHNLVSDKKTSTELCLWPTVFAPMAQGCVCLLSVVCNICILTKRYVLLENCLINRVA